MLALLALVAAPAGVARAQLAEPDSVAPASMGVRESYRDGASEVTVEREPRTPSTLQRVRLRSGDFAFGAAIDAHAIVQLAPDSDAPEVWRRERLQPVRPLSRALAIYLVSGAANEDGVQIAQRLERAPGVLEAVPDLYVARRKQTIELPPNDPMYAGQWYLKRVMIEAAWRHSTGDPATTIVVVDDGCDMQHPDLVDNMLEGRDLVDMDDDPGFAPGLKGNAHGTQCAGLIAARADNGIGIAGVCPECTLRCVRLLRDDDHGVPISSDIAAFDYALDVGASVVSNSWGFAEAMPVPVPLKTLLQRLYTQGRNGLGTLVVFSAGNENRELRANEIDAVEGVLSVAAVNNFDESAPFSNFGPSLDLAAPTGTFTTDVSGPDGDDEGDYTDLFGGTSSACPIVAGSAGLVMSARPDLTASEISDALLQNARKARYASPDDSGHDPVYGYGIVDPGAAVRSVLGVSDEEAADAGSRDASVAPTDKGGDSSCAVRQVGATSAESAALAILVMSLAVWLRRRSAQRTRRARMLAT